MFRQVDLPPDVRSAFAEDERQVRLRVGKLGCALVTFLMPLGSLPDLLVYREHAWIFFLLRCLCAVLTAGLWFLHTTRFGASHYQFLALPIALLPVAFLCWMIYLADGPLSPYYAALNLVLLGVSAVMRWGARESWIAVGSTLMMYFMVCLPLANGIEVESFFLNSYFIVLTGIIMVAGNHFFTRVRMREFLLRHEVERNRQDLARQNQALADASDQLNETEKLASIGELSAGLIHEINNPINFSATGIYALKKRLEALPEDQRHEYVELITEVDTGVRRVKDIVNNLRQFAHPHSGSKEDVLVAELVESATLFLRAEWRGQVKIDQSLAPGLTIHANKNDMIRVFLNLLKNSLDALRQKQFGDGAGEPRISIQGQTAGSRVVVSIRDNGPGIPKEHHARVADILGMGHYPDSDNEGRVLQHFFTTKEAGAGMGMGLSICRRIVQASSGRMSFKTEPGEWCEFTLDLPAVIVPQSA